MHIGINCLILKSGEYSGVHVAVRGMVNSLVENCGEHDGFSLYTQRRNPGGLPFGRENVRRIVPRFPIGFRTGRILYEQFRMHARVFDDNIDLLHCPAYVAPRLCSKPVVVNIHDCFALRVPQLCTKANVSHFSRMVPHSMRIASRIIVPSEYVKNEILAYNKDADEKKKVAGVEEKISVIPWGIDPVFAPVEDKRRLDEVALKYGLPPKFVLFVGRIEPKKNVLNMLKSYFAAVMAKDLPHRLVMVGPKGWGVDKTFAREVKELGLENKVIFPGFVERDDLPAIYSAASAMFFPSLAEGFGFPVLEAMACGTPVICSNIPVMEEVAGDAAVKVHPVELPAMREGLEKVLCDDGFASSLREKGLKQASRFGWESHTAQLLQLYSEVIEEDKTR